ncbi:DUF1127 domain-containing protein [Pseudogemmobacter humi]
MRMLHGSIAEASVVQPQKETHVSDNKKGHTRPAGKTEHMAYVNTSRAVMARPSLAADILAALRGALARRRLYVQTVNELNSLSERDLSDLGLNRSMISEVAREAAYGK